MLLDTASETSRDAFLAASHARGVLCRPAWTGMHRLPMYEDCPRMDLSDAEALEARIVNLPSSMVLEMGRDTP
jgi:perosamine synthetase